MKILPRVIILEDDIQNAKMFSAELREADMDVEVVRTLNRLYKRIEENHLDAAIIDIMIKKKGQKRGEPLGLEAIRYLRGSKPDIYIEVQTAYSRRIEEAWESGADEVIRKPKGWGPEAPDRIIRGVLRKRIHKINQLLNIEMNENIVSESRLNTSHEAAVILQNANFLIDYMPAIREYISEKSAKFDLDEEKAINLSNELIEYLIGRTMGEKEQEINLYKGEFSINKEEFHSQLSDLRKKYNGQYVVFANGELAFTETSLEEVIRKIGKNFPDDNPYVRKIETQEGIVDMGGPK